MSLIEEPKTLPTLLNKPANIYSNFDTTVAEEPAMEASAPENVFELSIKEDSLPAVESFAEEIMPQQQEEELNFEITNKVEPVAEMPTASIVVDDLSEEEEQRKRALERIQKLRNLSYNMNNSEPNTEFDNVPAYVRRNMELFGNTLTTVENFYSKVTVDKDENNQAVLSTKNSFLDGNRPD